MGVLFIDFRPGKTFDTVNYTILLEKLKAIGILGDLLSWLDDYISARKQFAPRNIRISVFVQNHHLWSSPGSIFGPKLVSIFVNDRLPEAITSGDLFMVADDTTIFTIGENIDNIMLTLQIILDQVYTWCHSNRSIAHESKSEAMIISSQKLIGPLPRWAYGNSTTEYKVSSKCLGLTISNKLSWQ